MDLIDDARHRLQRVWGHDVAVSAVRVRLRDRAVFDTVSPDGCPVVVKVDTTPRRLDKELLMLRTARDGGIPVPAVLIADDGSPGFLVLARAEGSSLSATSTWAAWAAAGRYLRRLHGLPPPPGIPQFNDASGDWRDFMLGWADKAASEITRPGMLSPAEAGRLRSQLSAALIEMNGPPYRLLHGDCQPDHFLIEPGGRAVMALIDFGDSSIGDPAWDFAVLTLHHARRLDSVLRGYRPGRQLLGHITRWVPAYRALRCAGVVRWLADNGLDHRADLEFLQREHLRANPR